MIITTDAEKAFNKIQSSFTIKKYSTNQDQKKTTWDFSGGAVVKNPPASAGDTGSIPGL